jgi:hypothetical protein
MTSNVTDWHQALARVTGELVRGEQRVTTHELLTEHVGVPVTDRACRRLRRVMRQLGWRGPRRMRWGDRTSNGYWRHPTVGLPAIVRDQPVAEAVTMGEGTLAPELERVTRLGLQKLEQILRIPTDRGDGNLLRAQTAAATTALNTQLRADEARLREKRSDDTIARLLELIRQERAARAQQVEAARKASIVTLDPSDQPDDGGEGADASPSQKT